MGKIKALAYRLKLRMVLQKASIEELTITKEECKREFDRRNAKNGRNTKRINESKNKMARRP